VPRAFACCETFNRLPYADQDAIRSAFSELTGRPIDERFRLVPPLHSDHGFKLRLGAFHATQQFRSRYRFALKR
jgi:hypothetical protein